MKETEFLRFVTPRQEDRENRIGRLHRVAVSLLGRDTT